MQFIQRPCTVTLVSRNILKLNHNSHTHLTETPSFAWHVAAALKPLP